MSFINPELTPVAARTRTYLLKDASGTHHTRTACPVPLGPPPNLSGFSLDSVASCMERPRPCSTSCTRCGTTVSCIARGLEFDDLCDANLTILSAFVRGAIEGDIQGRFKVD